LTTATPAGVATLNPWKALLMLAIVWLVLVFVAGLVVLYFGAEGTLHGAVSIATRMGVSQLVIGLTLVAFGTSCPELSLDISAAIQGNSELAFGDLVGSNIANVGLILGIGAIVSPLRVHMRLLRAEVPIAVSTSLLVLALALDGIISRQDGVIMLAAFVLFVGYSFRAARQESSKVQREFKEIADVDDSVGKSAMMVVAGLVGLVVGAQLMVYSAVEAARMMGISPLVIGLTIVALGTSLPELATSIVAAKRQEADIVVGNVIGSNIFNMLLVLAVVAIICPVSVAASSLQVDLPAMIAFVAVLIPIMVRGMVVSRWEGALLVVGYFCFLGWQVLATLRDVATAGL
jgi:cation:H+ antiporter